MKIIKQELQKIKGFWHSIMSHFHKRICYDKDENYKIVSDDLIANLFRISQTEQKLKRDNIQTEKGANKAHYEVSSKIRKTINELGGTLPENLPVPKKSLKQLEKENA